MCFLNVSNALTIDVMERHATEQISAGESQIQVPALPFASYGDPSLAVGAELSGNYGTITFAPFDRWDWDAYWEAHNIPIVEEYDDEVEKMDDINILEED